MTEQQEAEFVEQAFEKLKERGWFADQELERSTVTEEEIAASPSKMRPTLIPLIGRLNAGGRFKLRFQGAAKIPLRGGNCRF